MISTLILAVACTGQYNVLQRQQCLIRGQYPQRGLAYSYAVPAATYGTGYAYDAKVYTNYAPVVYQDYYAIVGDQQRSFDRRLEALKSQADLALRLDKIASSLQGLNSLVANPPAVQAAPDRYAVPDAPSKPLPPVPAKPSPQSPEQPPPLPKTNPDDGSVPPPPPVPGVGATGGFSAETAAVFVARCQKCHSTAMAPKQGGEFALFNDDGSPRSNLTGVEMLKILQQVETGKMPRKANPLSAEERAFIRADVFGSKAVETALAQ